MEEACSSEIWHCLPDKKVSYPRKHEPSSTLLSEPHMNARYIYMVLK